MKTFSLPGGRIRWSLSCLMVALSLVLAPLSPLEAGADDAMTDTEKLAVANDMLDAWHRLDWEKIYALFGKDGILHNMMLEPTVGEAALRERLTGLENGLTRMDFIILRMGVINGEVVVERIDSFDYNGSSGEVPVVGVMRIADGKVKEWREYYDRNTLLAGLGLKDNKPETSH